MINIEMDIDSLQRQIIARTINIDFAPIMPAIKQIIKNSIDRNFQNEGRFGNDNKFQGGSNKWEKSKTATKRSGITLSNHGHLASSIQVEIRQFGTQIIIEVGSNLAYAAIHQFGGTINMPARSRLYKQNRQNKNTKTRKKGQFKKGTTYGQGITTGEYKIVIPARPYLVLQNEDLKEIQRIIANHIKTSLIR